MAAWAAVMGMMATGAAFAGAMPPEYDDPVPARALHVPEPLAPAMTRPQVLAPAPPAEAPPLPGSALTVTYAQDVGFFARRGYEDVKEDASVYCAQYGRVATLDSRFEVGETWYVRFDCITPR
jgi:hypothetical protein